MTGRHAHTVVSIAVALGQCACVDYYELSVGQRPGGSGGTRGSVAGDAGGGMPWDGGHDAALDVVLDRFGDEEPVDVEVDQHDGSCPAVSEPAGAPPLHYWALDDIAGSVILDAIGDVHGAGIGDIRQVPGLVGSALLLDGASYVRFSGGMDFEGSLSFALWYENEGPLTGQVLLAKGMSGSSTPRNTGYALLLDASMLRFMVGDGAIATVAAAAPVAPGFHHVAAVLDRGRCELRLYLDGQLGGVGVLSGLGRIVSNGRFALGAHDRYPGSQSVNQFFTGRLDEVSAYGRPLTDTEVSELFDDGRRHVPAPAP